MKLDRIEINNFRSIKKETIIFDHNCLILLGKNEAGKSNILKAIAFLFNEYLATLHDKRKKIKNEKIDEYSVKAIISNSPEDIEIISRNVKSIFDSIYNFNDLYNQNLLKFTTEVLNKFGIIKTIDESPFTEVYLNSELNWEELHTKYFYDVVAREYDSFKDVVLRELREYYLSNSFRCHYWKYDDNYLLPNTISIKSFTENPNIVKGLKNIFILCGREDIQNEFIEAYNQDGDFANLLEQVSSEVTHTFRKIWKDFKQTKIELIHNGGEILIKVTDRAKYSFQDRSDGFKKFISVLLMLSTQSRAGKLSNKDIILIDEPDQSLYPTSAQYLKDELLDIGKTSVIVYSTHSQYMIDSNNIERHLEVRKDNDITTLSKFDPNSPFSDDELMRRAIGSSIFECLKEKNIIFEGWLDKQLFVFYCKNKNIDLKEYGIVFLHGISGVETLVQILILANKKFVIVADADQTSNNKRKSFIVDYKEYKENWIGYSDIVNSADTMEDFITEEKIRSTIKANGFDDSEYKSDKKAIYNIEKACNNKEARNKIKFDLIEDLKINEVKVDYIEFIEKVIDKLNTI